VPDATEPDPPAALELEEPLAEAEPPPELLGLLDPHAATTSESSAAAARALTRLIFKVFSLVGSRPSVGRPPSSVVNPV
jgi:hypothetical protein